MPVISLPATPSDTGLRVLRNMTVASATGLFATAVIAAMDPPGARRAGPGDATRPRPVYAGHVQVAEILSMPGGRRIVSGSGPFFSSPQTISNVASVSVGGAVHRAVNLLPAGPPGISCMTSVSSGR